jgi:cholera toxin transcriptional activator
MLHWRSIRMSTTPPAPTGHVVRFGIFEANLSLGELRKNGAKIRLQEQPFQVLAILLERPGEVVTREDLRMRLWNAETFVDFDHSLNTAINKLRDALDDSAANPRFVETLAKRGYRFIAPVRRDELHAATSHPTPASEISPSVVSPSNASPAIATATVPPVIRSSAPHSDLPIVHRAWPRTLLALLQIMYLVFYVLALIHWDEVGIAAGMNLAQLRTETVATLVLLTAAVGIPLRLYLLSSVSFDYSHLGEKFRRLFPAVLFLDLLWACAPFLILHQIGVGGAVAAMAALLYVPFAERTLVRMAYPGIEPLTST